MFSYRIATNSDIPLLQKLADEIWHQHYPGILSLEQIDYMLKNLYDHETISREIRQGFYWVILRYNNEAAGFIACEMESNKICKLHKIYIYPHLHGLGIGRKAIDLAKEFARKQGADTLKLNVNRGNKESIKAYQAMGFSIDKEEDLYLGDFLLDDYVMSQEVTIREI